MQSSLKFVFVFIHVVLIGLLSIFLLRGLDAVNEKLVVSLLIFITLNLIRLLGAENKADPDDQF
jgi:hypothetical protein